MADIKDRILKTLHEVTGLEEVDIESPENEAFGDYSTNSALVLAKEKEESPRKLAEEILSKLQKNKDLSEIIEKIEIAGPGFINFWLKKDILINTLKQIDIAKSDFGKSNIGKGKTVIVDYSSPNIAKPFGIGHLRSTIIGQALYNLYKALGYEVVGDNHLGDWGTQFGKLIYMIETEKPADLSIETLEKLYVEFHKMAEKDPDLEEKARECFKKLEQGDPEAKKIWQKCVDVSIAEFDRIYETLGIKTDFAFGESYYESEMKQMLNDSDIKKYVIKGDEGALVIDLSKEGIKTPLMFLKSDGATTYATRDLATIKFRVRKWDPSVMVYEVGAEQSLYFQQIFAAAKLLGLVKDSVKLAHTAHGLYLAPDGKKFSTRKGKTIKLEDVLSEAIERAEKLGNNKGTAKDVGIGAIKYFDLMHSVTSNVVFDWEKMMNLEGNSGPYLQYTVARCNSVLAKANFKGLSLEADYSNLDSEETSILRTLIKFPETVEKAAESFAPNLICNYIYDLASKYNGFYNKDKIIGGENEDFRLALTFGVGQVLKNGLKLLGITSPERM
ncbi:MAG: hypothetical protein ACD_13C00142G0016 [uncultured bacterium]|nr:MAG: hypothetical protein ACD_13C00142G0016 [uncultured bacterium]KKR56850.1 MAG: Arginine-tRNA ligase [Candidatus Woesebacteria bacterium GW2011_GWC2_40_30]HAU65679.1 arginine--tRNA ligase [Candidatus Woesebacteria bacterium]HCC08467.1 arginine--tRNA ligase [Candidatus Woesebacteria bacterium]